MSQFLTIRADVLMPNLEFCRNYRETLKYSINIMSQLTREDLLWLDGSRLLHCRSASWIFDEDNEGGMKRVYRKRETVCEKDAG